ncbi:hypothetical protein Tco_0212063 [Tanacetum coccineum]
MHIQNDPSFFLTNKIGAPQGEELGLIKPLSEQLFSCSDTLSSRKAPMIRMPVATDAAPANVLNFWPDSTVLGCMATSSVIAPRLACVLPLSHVAFALFLERSSYFLFLFCLTFSIRMGKATDILCNLVYLSENILEHINIFISHHFLRVVPLAMALSLFQE